MRRLALAIAKELTMDFKSRLRAAVAAVALVGVAAFTPSSAQAVSATANATVDIVAALTISNTADLDFGAVIPAAGADTVVISSAGARTCGATLTCTDTFAAANFSVSGGNNLSYTITLPASASLTGPGTAMTVDTFTDDKSGLGTLNGSGNGGFLVGATLNVGASQVAGTYTGTFSVTADYN